MKPFPSLSQHVRYVQQTCRTFAEVLESEATLMEASAKAALALSNVAAERLRILAADIRGKALGLTQPLRTSPHAHPLRTSPRGRPPKGTEAQTLAARTLATLKAAASPMSMAVLGEQLQASRKSVATALSRLLKDGDIERTGRSLYRAPRKPASIHPLRLPQDQGKTTA